MTMTVEALPQTAPVREVTMNLLRDLGMTTMFGNPGSTELRFLKDWPADFTYVMGLHEGASVAMADAFAQVTGNAAFVSLHSAGGLGNAMGTLYTAFRNGAPLVIMAGQQTRAMLGMDPFLFAQDAASFPKPYVKWSVEPARAQDVPAAIARAYYMAMQRPWGPTFVSVPEDDWDAQAPLLAVRKIYADFVADPAALDALAAAFDASNAPAIVVGSGVDRDGAAELAVQLAERTGAHVYSSALAGRASFPETHPHRRRGATAGARSRCRAGCARVQLPYPRRRAVHRTKDGALPAHRRFERRGVGRNGHGDHHELTARARSAAAAFEDPGRRARRRRACAPETPG
jgi:benzoylformate decarboxylase